MKINILGKRNIFDSVVSILKDSGAKHIKDFVDAYSENSEWEMSGEKVKIVYISRHGVIIYSNEDNLRLLAGLMTDIENKTFEYGISNWLDEEIFFEQCKELEDTIPGLVKQDLLIDVDSSKIQTYLLEGKRVGVYLDFGMKDVYIKSEFDIGPFFA